MQQIRSQQHRKDESVNGPPEVGVMVDIVAAPLRHVLEIKKINDPEQNTRYGNGGKKINLVPRIEEYGGEQHGGQDGDGGQRGHPGARDGVCEIRRERWLYG